MKVALDRIANLHTSIVVRGPGRGNVTRLVCRSCTREAYPCPTLQAVDRARQDAQ